MEIDKDPELRELAHAALLKLAEGLVESVKACEKLKDGQTLDPDKEPVHIIEELQSLARFC